MEKHDAPPIKRTCVRGMHASAAGSAAGGSAAVVVNDGANATAIRDVVTTALDLNVKAVAATGPPQFVSIKSYLDGWFKLGPVVSPGRPRVLPIKQTEMSTALPKMSRSLDEPRSQGAHRNAGSERNAFTGTESASGEEQRSDERRKTA